MVNNIKIVDNSQVIHNEIMGSLTLHLIKIISEEFAKYRLIPYLCCQKEESADRKGKLY